MSVEELAEHHHRQATCVIFRWRPAVRARQHHGVDDPRRRGETSSAGSKTLTISTSSDTTPVTIAQLQRDRGPAFHLRAVLPWPSSPPSTAAGAVTTYTIGFKTSMTTRALSGDAGSTYHCITAPAGFTGFGSMKDTPVSVAGTEVGECEDSGTTTDTCVIFSGDTVAASTTVSMVLNGVVNPSAGSKTLTISTSSDTTPVTSPSYSVTAAQPVSAVTVGLSSSVPHATGVTYTIGFKTSATGALSGDAGSTITVTAPAGTGFGSLGATPVSVAGTEVGECEDSGTTTDTCVIFSGDTIAANTTVSMVLNGVVNPAAGTYTLGISTSSDTTSVNSPSYTVGGAPAPTIKRLKPARGAVGKRVIIIKGTNLTGCHPRGLQRDGGRPSTSDPAAKIVTKVPAGATPGKITVTTAGGTATSIKTFTVT